MSDFLHNLTSGAGHELGYAVGGWAVAHFSGLAKDINAWFSGYRSMSKRMAAIEQLLLKLDIKPPTKE